MKKKLSEIATIQRGKFSARPRNDPQYYGGFYPFIQTGDVTNAKSGYVKSYTQTLNEEGLRVSKLFPKGTILISIAANIGDVAEVEFDFACPDSLVAVNPNDEVDKDWLKYVLITKKRYFESRATTNAQANINLEIIKPVIIAVPSLDEQKQIVSLLSKLDTLIQTTEQLLERKERMYAGVLSEYIKKLENESKNEHIDLGSIVTIQTGKKDVNEGNPHGKYPFYTCGREIQHSDTYSFDFEAILIAGNGDIGNPKYYKGKFEAYQRTYVLNNFQEIIPKYLLAHLKLCLERKVQQESQHGAMPYIKLNTLSKYKIKIVDHKKQKEVSELFELFENDMSIISNLISKYKLQKQGLMQRLLVGEDV